jgi:hypothetical protein
VSLFPFALSLSKGEGQEIVTRAASAERLPRVSLSPALSESCDLPLKLFDLCEQIQHNPNADPIYPEIMVKAEDTADPQDRRLLKKRLWRCFYWIDQPESHEPLCQRGMNIRQACDLT